VSAADAGRCPDRASPLALADWRRGVVRAVRSGSRLAGLFGSEYGDGCLLVAVVADGDRMDLWSTFLLPDEHGRFRYPALSGEVAAAFWYERALHDLSGVLPEGHPRLDPLLLARAQDSPVPRPGAGLGVDDEQPRFDEQRGPVDIVGRGMFSLPLGPVRSGVVESIEFLIETPGEDIPHLNVRPHYKHRGIAKQFEGRRVADAVLVAERVEGISSVAHALAFCHAVEEVAQVDVDEPARALRLVLAELERIANHLDVTMRLADSAGLAVATSRFGWHKETTQRLMSALTGSRFGRGAIGVGGLARPLDLGATVRGDELVTALRRLARRVDSDVRALESSASFLDRLRTTGPLTRDRAAEHGALGPIGRGSGVDHDARRDRPYDAYDGLRPGPVTVSATGDALARARVRWAEIQDAVDLVARALATAPADLRVEASRVDDRQLSGSGVGWSESAQGEVVHVVELADGRVRRCFARSASFHNLLLLHDVFATDIFTDFPFIEASFGLGYAGVAM
jgi:Ni,Fe-hydrogenase III large subunit